MALVDVTVDVDEGWPNHTSVDVDLAEIAGARNTSGDHGENLPFTYLDIHQGQPVAVRL
jgi:hypothetical protein